MIVRVTFVRSDTASGNAISPCISVKMISENLLRND